MSARQRPTTRAERLEARGLPALFGLALAAGVLLMAALEGGAIAL